MGMEAVVGPRVWRGGVWRVTTTTRRERWACWVLQSCPLELRERERTRKTKRVGFGFWRVTINEESNFVSLTVKLRVSGIVDDEEDDESIMSRNIFGRFGTAL